MLLRPVGSEKVRKQATIGRGGFAAAHRLTARQRQRWGVDAETCDEVFNMHAWAWGEEEPAPHPKAKTVQRARPSQAEGEVGGLAGRLRGDPRLVYFGAKAPERDNCLDDGKLSPGRTKWCNYGHGGSVWQVASYHEGNCQAPSHARVRGWNRYVAAATTQRADGDRVSRANGGRRADGDVGRRHRHAARTVDLGRRLWSLRERVRKGVIPRPNKCGLMGDWEDTLHSYDAKGVVYVRVPLVRGEKAYVGVTGGSAWDRELKRTSDAARLQPSALPPYEAHLHKRGREATINDYYIMVLEQLEPTAADRRPPPGAPDGWRFNFEQFAKPWERFWVQTLRTGWRRGGKQAGGWNVDFSPKTKPLDYSGKVQRASRGRGGGCLGGQGKQNGMPVRLRRRQLSDPRGRRDTRTGGWHAPPRGTPEQPWIAHAPEGWQQPPPQSPVPSPPPSPPGSPRMSPPMSPPRSPLMSPSSENDNDDSADSDGGAAEVGAADAVDAVAMEDVVVGVTAAVADAANYWRWRWQHLEGAAGPVVGVPDTPFAPYAGGAIPGAPDAGAGEVARKGVMVVWRARRAGQQHRRPARAARRAADRAARGVRSAEQRQMLPAARRRWFGHSNPEQKLANALRELLTFGEERLRVYIKSLVRRSLQLLVNGSLGAIARLRGVLRDRPLSPAERREVGGLIRDSMLVADVAVRARYDVRIGRGQKERRGPVPIGYVGSCIDSMRFNRALLNDDAMSSVPASIWQVIGKPFGAYLYSSPPALKILNFAQLAFASPPEKLSEEECSVQCVCHLPEFASYLHAPRGHIITKDLSIIGRRNPQLRKLMEFGTRHRDSHQELIREGTLQEDLVGMVDCALAKYIKIAAEEHDIDPDLLRDWREAVVSSVSSWAKAMTDAELQQLEVEQANANTLAACVDDLEWLHARLNIGRADKEGGVYVIQCRRCYRDEMFGSLHTSTYMECVGQSPTDVGLTMRTFLLGEKLWPSEKLIPRVEKGVMLTLGDGQPKMETMEQMRKRIIKLAYQYGQAKTHRIPIKNRGIAGGTGQITAKLNKWCHRVLWALRPDVDAMHGEVMRNSEARWLRDRFGDSPNDASFIINGPVDVVRRVRNFNGDVRRHAARREVYARQRQRDGVEPEELQLREGRSTWRGLELAVVDFNTLYPSLLQALVKATLRRFFARVWARHRDEHGVARVLRVVLRREDEDGSSDWCDVADVKPDTAKVRYFTEARITDYVDFLMDNCFVTFEGAVYKQVKGVPIGAGAAPMIANLLLAMHEIEGLESIVRDAYASAALVSHVSTPSGWAPVNDSTRVELLDLAGRLSRCCRMIDDVLLIDLSKKEQDWAMNRLYKPRSTGLTYKVECRSPAVINYLDVTLAVDGHGLHTVLYSKRDALALEGKIDAVWGFPDPLSVLSPDCLYNCLTGFLCRTMSNTMRTAVFISNAGRQMFKMWPRGYDQQLLIDKLNSFTRHKYQPAWRARFVGGAIMRDFEDRRIAETERRRQQEEQRARVEVVLQREAATADLAVRAEWARQAARLARRQAVMDQLAWEVAEHERAKPRARARRQREALLLDEALAADGALLEELEAQLRAKLKARVEEVKAQAADLLTSLEPVRPPPPPRGGLPVAHLLLSLTPARPPPPPPQPQAKRKAHFAEQLVAETHERLVAKRMVPTSKRCRRHEASVDSGLSRRHGRKTPTEGGAQALQDSALRRMQGTARGLAASPGHADACAAKVTEIVAAAARAQGVKRVDVMGAMLEWQRVQKQRVH